MRYGRSVLRVIVKFTLANRKKSKKCDVLRDKVKSMIRQRKVIVIDLARKHFLF